MRIDPIPDFESVRLIFRPMPIEGESWPDYVIRLAEANYIGGGMRAMASLAGMYANQLLVATPSEVLLRFGVILPETLREHPLDSPPERKLKMASRGRCKKTRLCPLCLTADVIPYIRAEWGMPMSIACQQHRTMLIDRCHACDQPLDIFRNHILRCQCGAALQKQVPLPAEPGVELLRELFAEAYDAQDTATFARAHAHAQKAARVCKWLLAASVSETARRSTRPLDTGGFLSVEDAISITKKFSGSKVGIAESLLTEVRLSRTQKYHSLNRGLGVREFAQMNSVVDEVKRLQMQLDGPYPREKRRAEVMAKNDVYPLSDLTELTGYSHATLARYVELGHLPGSIVFDEVLGRSCVQIPGTTYRAIDLSFLETDSIETAAVKAGCTVWAMKSLVHARCIGADRLLPIQLGPSGARVRLADRQEFMRVLFLAAEFEGKHRSRRVYFSDWASGKELSWVVRKWQRILAAIKEGRIRIFKAVEHPTALEDLYVAPEDLVKVLGPRFVLRIRRVSRPTQSAS
jgi:hypothetical protein